MEKGSPQSEDLLEIAGEDNSGHENEYVEHVTGGEQVLEVQGNAFESASHQNFSLDSNNLENVNNQLFEIERNNSENHSEHVLEVEIEEKENEINVLEVEANSPGISNPHTLANESDDQEVAESQGQTAVMDDGQSSSQQGMHYHPPVVGMDFESYDDAYNYYNCYAKELGFAIRVKSSWTKRYSKEKRGAVLCCNCEGFKTVKEATVRRKETRTGCLAMLRIRLAESNRWKVDEVKLDHNHPFDPRRAQNSKSHKKIEAEANKRKFEPDLDVEVRTIKLYHSAPNDISSRGTQNSAVIERGSSVSQSKRLKLKGCDIQAVHDFFCQHQLKNPNFLYLMDLNDEGQLRNVFWIDSRSRSAYGYFRDVIVVDTTCLANDYDIPLLAFVGINHHGYSILLGCGLLADETVETFVWIFRAWLTCMLGRPPQTIITTDQSKAMQNAISEVIPRAHHRLCLQLVMQSMYRNLGPLHETGVLQTVLNRTVYGSLKVDEFENSWECMVTQFGMKDFKWVQSLYEDRERWAPVYLKDTFLAGFAISPQLANEPMVPFFNGHLNKQTSLREFFDIYDSVLQNMHQKETLADSKSIELNSASLRTRCSYELQLSKLYTKSIFRKFQTEVEAMASCVNISQVHSSGPMTTYMIKEQDVGPSGDNYRNFEVVYDHTTVEVQCVCGCFQLNGYLCRHALSTLNYNGVEDIPSHYILSRWRRDCKRLYVTDFGGLGSNTAVDVLNPLQRHDHLCRKVTQIVEEGIVSPDHYMVAWQAFKKSLNKVRLSGDQEKNIK